MSKLPFTSLRYRALLTETLPYEVPLIFSNDRYFVALSVETDDPPLVAEYKKLLELHGVYSIPYTYEVRKNSQKNTNLGIIHPIKQKEIAEFYERFAGIMLHHCGVSESSLRHPASVAPFYGRNVDSNDGSATKKGVVHAHNADDLPDLSHIISYFTYESYNLLGKFVDSREFLRYEKRYSFLRTLDVSKCFFNIYTHSIGWAVKSKELAKKTVNCFSFEAEMDLLMQRCNYNETNGIVVGPEFSRVFAEIILQDVDREVAGRVEDRTGFRAGREYVMRRYVDDYFIFGDSVAVLDKVSDAIAAELERYKLFLNSAKRETKSRPFVSKISLAKQEVKRVLSELHEQIDTESVEALVSSVKAKNRAIRRKVNEVRIIVAKYDIEFNNLSAWLLGALHRVLSKISRRIDSKLDANASGELIRPIGSILELVFYICSVDFRVRTTYALGQIVGTVFQLKEKLEDSSADQVEQITHEELVQYISVADIMPEDYARKDWIEVFNVLLCGAHFIGTEFVKDKQVLKMLRRLNNVDGMTYFRFVTLKFCFLKAPQAFKVELDVLNDWAESRLSSPERIRLEAECFLLLCDFLSSPDVAAARKGKVFRNAVGGNAANATVERLGQTVGFSDWDGVRISHLLKRRKLRPVYT
ncbi:MAG: RNA-directed DNA polymerase [Proteobacteria bacterium]|nr:MAG: RNA-directed DNA polymerase [Pseudomonadota bacterium]